MAHDAVLPPNHSNDTLHGLLYEKEMVLCDDSERLAHEQRLISLSGNACGRPEEEAGLICNNFIPPPPRAPGTCRC